MHNSKKCKKCNITKTIEEFSSKKESKDGKHSYCKNCIKTLMLENYRKFPERKKERDKKAREKVMNEINLMKSKIGCLYCQEKDPIVLDFHHVNPKNKEKEVSYWVRAKSITRALNEIKKCVVVCANHHRRLEAKTISLPNYIYKKYNK
jgi:hypothetical protein